MDYYQCEECKQKFTGWAVEKTCKKCGSKLKEISREEFEKK